MEPLILSNSPKAFTQTTLTSSSVGLLEVISHPCSLNAYKDFCGFDLTVLVTVLSYGEI